MSSAERVRFPSPFGSEELVGTVVDSDWRPEYNAQDRTHVRVAVEGCPDCPPIRVDAAEIVEVGEQ